MLNAINANTEADLAELRACLEKTKKCSVVGTLRQLASNAEGKVSSVEISQAIAETSKNLIQINGNMVYANLTEVDGNFNDLNKIREVWRAMLNRGTVKFMKGEPNDYDVTIDFVKSELENGKAYCLSFHNPIFMALEDKGIFFAVPFEDFLYSIEDVTLAEVEYAEEINAERNRDAYEDEEEYDEQEDEWGLDNGEFIDNDDLLEYVDD